MGVIRKTFWAVNTTAETIKLVSQGFLSEFKRSVVFVEPGAVVEIPNAAWTGGLFRDKRLKQITQEDAEAMLAPPAPANIEVEQPVVEDEPEPVVDEPVVEDEPVKTRKKRISEE